MSRSIRTQPVSPEQICFPLVAQAARLLRQTDGRQDEHVTLLTSAAPDKLDAQKWLELNRAGFGGIENGLHQRLDVSHNDDHCRIRNAAAMSVAGLFRRISNSLFMEWRSHQPHPEYLTTTDFQAAMGEDHCRPAIRLIFNKRPSLKPPSGSISGGERLRAAEVRALAQGWRGPSTPPGGHLGNSRRLKPVHELALGPTR